MRKIISVILTIAVMCFGLAVCVDATDASTARTIVLTIGSPTMFVDGVDAEIDPGRGTTPIIENERTLLPVRAIVEAFGGTVTWDESAPQSVELAYGNDTIQFTIDSNIAFLNGESQTLDVTPIVVNDRTMMPIRFIAESFKWSVEWNGNDQTVTISKAAPEHTNPFDFEKGTVLLNNGIEMPINGIGTFTLSDEQAEDTTYWALQSGARLIDTATAYNNEEGVGRGIKRAIDDGIVTRDEIFVTTKLWPSAYNMGGIDACLDRLGLDYVDLMLLHQPMGDYVGGYQAMEQAVAEGKIRAIGVSNFRPQQFEELMKSVTITPAVNQVETHPYYQEKEMIEFLDQYGTVLEAWFPLGGRGHTQELLNDPAIVEIANAHGKSSAQVILLAFAGGAYCDSRLQQSRPHQRGCFTL